MRSFALGLALPGARTWTDRRAHTGVIAVYAVALMMPRSRKSRSGPYLRPTRDGAYGAAEAGGGSSPVASGPALDPGEAAGSVPRIPPA